MPLGKAQKNTVFRLHGDLQGASKVFVLDPGDNRVGADPANPIYIPVRQVSRRHAVLTVDSDGVVLEDLGSTNGTFVNGVRVRRAKLGESDWVQFGPVLLTFEALSADEHALAIALDDQVDAAPEVPSREPSTTEIGLHPHNTVLWGETLARCADLLFRRPDEDVDGAIGALASALGDDTTVVLLHRLDSGDATVQAAAGDLSRLDWHAHERWFIDHSPASDRRTGVSCARLAEKPPVTAAASWSDGTWHSALLVAGRNIDTAEYSFLEVTLRMLDTATAPYDDPEPSEPTASGQRLDLPEWHVVGRSPSMARLYRQLETLLKGSVPILVTGETGVGKEHVVRILHRSSDRARGPLQIVNCTAIPADLLEAELFGIEAGVATGVSRRRGKLRLAHGGVLFLDEIGDMNPALQAKLLRALQEGEVQPLGAASPVTVDVRIIAATNTDLAQRVREGLFRKDLYYRIAGCEVHVPPLRDRRDDIPDLARHFLERAAREQGKSIRGLSIRALEKLQSAPWPGNVRQLQREITRLVASCPAGRTIDSTMLAPSLFGQDPSRADDLHEAGLDLKVRLAALERELIERALAEADGNHSEAARLLGVTRNGLTMKMKRLDIDPPPVSDSR